MSASPSTPLPSFDLVSVWRAPATPTVLARSASDDRVSRAAAIHVRRLHRMWSRSWSEQPLPLRLYHLIRMSFPGLLMPGEVLRQLHIRDTVLQMYWRIFVLPADCNAERWQEHGDRACLYCVRAERYWANEGAKRWARLIVMLQETVHDTRMRYSRACTLLGRIPALCRLDILERHMRHLSFPATTTSTTTPGSTTAT